MITEICRLHRKLDSETEIVIKLAGDERQTIIHEDDTLQKVDNHTLKVIKPKGTFNPKGEIRLINLEYAMIVYYCRRGF